MSSPQGSSNWLTSPVRFKCHVGAHSRQPSKPIAVKDFRFNLIRDSALADNAGTPPYVLKTAQYDPDIGMNHEEFAVRVAVEQQ